MHRYEIGYRDNGIIRCRGFGYRDEFNKFLNKLLDNPARYTDVMTFNATVPGGEWKCYNCR